MGLAHGLESPDHLVVSDLAPVPGEHRAVVRRLGVEWVERERPLERLGRALLVPLEEASDPHRARARGARVRRLARSLHDPPGHARNLVIRPWATRTPSASRRTSTETKASVFPVLSTVASARTNVPPGPGLK